MKITQNPSLNFTGVLSESKKIIIPRYTHFLTLSLLFLPLSFSLITTPTLSRRLSDQPFTYTTHLKLLTTYLLYNLIVQVIALCAIATITYTTHHAFFGEPLTFLDSIKSLIFSFFPIAFTAIVAYALLTLITLTFLLLVLALLLLVNNLIFVIDYNSVLFVWFSAVMGAVLVAVMIYFQVKWSLAFVVVVVESKWGFSALIRSSYLVKGMRSVSLLVMLYFGVCGAIVVWICSVDERFNGVMMLLGSLFLMMFFLRMTAANAVLYNYCKAVHGELVIDDYMNLPADDEKVVTVVAA